MLVMSVLATNRDDRQTDWITKLLTTDVIVALFRARRGLADSNIVLMIIVCNIFILKYKLTNSYHPQLML